MRRTTMLLSGLAILMTLGCLPPEAPTDEATVDEGPVETERVTAEVGVGKQGQIIGDKQGFLRTPARAFINSKQKIAFLNVQQALNLYEAEHGYKPKSHEIFMDKIITFNNIELPELPEGQTYVWDADVGELMVEKPKQ